jgi:NAD(P)-dependent dehydrogenase (short-subunit alcohol dehydrogenase family)
MSGQDLAGKVAVVTGATSGIGEVVARELSARGARLFIIARDPTRAKATMATLASAASGQHEALFADLSSLSQMKQVAAEIASRELAVDLLINNAGARYPARQVTEDGLERTFALNHMSYLVVTLGLLDRLKAAKQGRVVSTSSQAHASRGLDFSDLQMARAYDGHTAYGRSKLCNILFTRALARRLAGTRVTANALHPGFVATRFSDADHSAKGMIIRGMRLFALSPEDGALTTLHVATSEECGRISGAYFARRQQTEPSAAARNDEDAERLWNLSTELAG